MEMWEAIQTSGSRLFLETRVDGGSETKYLDVLWNQNDELKEAIKLHGAAVVGIIFCGFIITSIAFTLHIIMCTANVINIHLATSNLTRGAGRAATFP